MRLNRTSCWSKHVNYRGVGDRLTKDIMRLGRHERYDAIGRSRCRQRENPLGSTREAGCRGGSSARRASCRWIAQQYRGSRFHRATGAADSEGSLGGSCRQQPHARRIQWDVARKATRATVVPLAPSGIRYSSPSAARRACFITATGASWPVHRRKPMAP